MADIQRLVQELQLHQVELEAQKAELEQAKAELQAALDHYTELYDSAPVGYLTLDRGGYILQLNLALASLLGQDRRQLVSKRFGQFVEAADRPDFCLFLSRAFASGMKESQELALCDPADQFGPTTVVRIDATREATEQTCRAVVVDITEAKKAEKLLQTHRDLLEAAVAERTAELVAANKELEGFTYAASHDLQGPLGRINNFSELLERRYGSQLEGEGQQFLQFIRENATRLSHLVDDLLSHARVGQQDMELEPLDIDREARAVLRERREDIHDREAQVGVKLAPARVMADSYSLRHVLINLLENALKYAAPDSSPRIDIEGQAIEGRYRLRVRDNGIGFDMKYHDKIFEIFRRLHTYSEYPGNGVGLALARRAMERMGGRIWAESAPGQGATFFLEVQLADPG